MAKLSQKDRLQRLSDHYRRGVQDMDIRRTRKNGWNDTVDSYMGKLPANWPHTSRVTDPRIRTAVLEKTARLLNNKLQGRVTPREGGDVVKARIQNAILDYQWDAATEGGSMIEKLASADQVSRLFGASFVLNYWDVEKNSNEIKLIDPRDIFFDGSATHVRNARWVQVREWTTWDKLEERGYNVNKWRKMAKSGEITADKQNTAYESVVRANRGLENRVGEQDDPENPVVEVVTEWTDEDCVIWLPKYDQIIFDGKNPYQHGQIPLSMLRYYPLPDEIYGESEVESVMPLQRAINFFLSGTIDELGLAIRPPLKLLAGRYRKESIEYGPGAQWIMNEPNAVTEAQLGQGTLSTFNVIYPALLAAFNTAMGDQSLGVSNTTGQYDVKTATEVKSIAQQQNSRDQYNQLYLAEFLKDIVLMWMSNTKQYMFDDPTLKYKVIKIIGQDNIKYFQQMMLDGKDVPQYAIDEIVNTITQNPEAVTPDMIDNIMQEVAVPVKPVIENPGEKNPDKYKIRSKFTMGENGQEGELAVTPDDFEGEYDYIPDVKSMSAGAGQMLADARNKAVELVLNPVVAQQLQLQGASINLKELLTGVLEDAGYKDAEGLFTNAQTQIGGGAVPPGAAGLVPGQTPVGNVPNAGIQGGFPPVPNDAGAAGIPQPQGIPG